MATPGVNCDVCLLFRGDVRYDSRAGNVLGMFHRIGHTCRVVQGAHSNESFEYAGATVESFEISRVGPGGFWQYWREARTLARDINARVWWAAELYSLPIAVKQARLTHGRAVYDAREIFAHLGALRSRPLTQQFWRYLEKRYAPQADAVLTSGEMDSEFLARRYRLPTPHVVLNVPRYRVKADSHLLHDRISAPRTTPVCVYSGGLQEGRGIEALLELARRTERAAFVFLGAGPLERLIQNAGIPNVHHIPAVANDQVVELLTGARVGLALIEPISESYRLALPNKLFEYIMAGFPVLTTDLPQMKKMVEQYGVGLTVPFGDENATANALRRLLVDEALHAKHVANCQNAAKELCWERQEIGLLEYLRARQII